jgi:hypothetical protein
LGVVSKEHVLRGAAGGFTQLCHGKKAALARMSPGDWLIFYSPTVSFGGDDRLKAFTAAGRVVDGEVYLFDMGGGFVPWRRRLAFLTPRDVPVERVKQRLSFIRDNPHWGYLARRGHFEIPVADAEVILGEMGASPRAALG